MALALYHNALSSCSQKVRLVLAELGLDFESHEINLVGGEQHDPAYVKLNPNHVVPTLVDDGQAFVESTLINEYLADRHPDAGVMPSDPAARHTVRLWTKRIDEKVHPPTSVVTFSIGARNALLQQPEEVREANIAAMPDPKKRAERRSVIEHGVKAPEFADALRAMIALFDDANAALASGGWLSGESFGVADAAALPYIRRLDQLAMTPLLDARPALADWYARVQARPSFAEAVGRWDAEPIIAMFRAAGEAVWADVEPLTR